MPLKISYLENLIKSYEAKGSFSASVSCFFIDQNQNPINLFSWQNGVKRPAASLIKLFILGTLAEKIAQEQCTFSQSLTISNYVSGSGLLKYVGVPAIFNIRELARLMIAYSDNSATNTLVSFVGIEQINDFINRLAARNTKIVVPMMPTAVEAKRGYNYTSAEDVMTFYKSLTSGFPSSIHQKTAQICKDLFASSRSSFIDTVQFLTSETNVRCIIKIAKHKPLILIKYLYATSFPLWRKRLTAYIPTQYIVAQKSATGKHIFHDSCIIGLLNGTLIIVSMIECTASNFYKKTSNGYRSASSLTREIGRVLSNFHTKGDTS